MTGHGTPADATTLMAQVLASDLDAPILDPSDMRWDRLLYSCPSVFDLRDRFRGALVGGAIGDAMGRPNEGARSNESRARRIREYQPWQGYRSGPKGTITDDTQMTMWMAEAILDASHEPRAESREGEPENQRSEGRDQQAANWEAGSGRLAAGRKHEDVRDSPARGKGQRAEDGSQQEREWRDQLGDRLIDPEDLAKRFTREHIRGIGQATREFVHNVKGLGKAWHEAGVPSAGNGTAMRAAPVGLVHLGDPYRIYRDSLLQSVVTHCDSMAIAAASCQAYAVARAAMMPPDSLASPDSRSAFCTDLAVLLDGLERPGYTLRGGRGASSLHDRIGTELPQYIREGRAPFDDWHNGAYVLESLPCALWCFLASPEDFEQTLFAAVDAGQDADTVAAMACSVAGAYRGYSRLPQRFLDDLEYRDHLVELADNLVGLHRRCYGAS